MSPRTTTFRRRLGAAAIALTIAALAATFVAAEASAAPADGNEQAWITKASERAQHGQQPGGGHRR